MPNWCWTKITINHEDKNKLKQLKSLINNFTSENYKENGFGLNWLGNIVGNSGIGTVDENPETDLRCRGSLTYLDCIDNQLIIDTETAWSPMLKMWIKLVDKYLPDAELIYQAEEGGNCLYSTNDPCLLDCYIIDSWNGEIESDYEASENTVRKLLQKLLETDITDIKELIDMFNESDHSEDMSINKWEYDEIDTWD